MKKAGSREGNKQRVRDLGYRRQGSHGRPVVPRPVRAPSESTLCRRCGAAHRAKPGVARRGGLLPALRGGAPIAVCPACLEIEKGRYLGRALLRGLLASANSGAIRRGVANVAAPPGFPQPERRLVSMRQDNEGLEVLITSETLAHRIVREIEKAFGALSSYAWSHRERTLFEVWQGGSNPSRRSRKGERHEDA